eukprot:2992057-Lingulodinium_polyedra.AAC.1
MQRALEEGLQAPSMDPVKRKAKVIGSVRVESERPLAFARVAAEDAMEAVQGNAESSARAGVQQIGSSAQAGGPSDPVAVFRQEMAKMVESARAEER